MKHRGFPNAPDPHSGESVFARDPGVKLLELFRRGPRPVPRSSRRAPGTREGAGIGAAPPAGWRGSAAGTSSGNRRSGRGCGRRRSETQRPGRPAASYQFSAACRSSSAARRTRTGRLNDGARRARGPPARGSDRRGLPPGQGRLFVDHEKQRPRHLAIHSRSGGRSRLLPTRHATIPRQIARK